MQDQSQTLGPGQAVMYAWQNPTGKRELIWSHAGKIYHDELIKVGNWLN